MDLLFKRYASPFLLIDGYINTGRFSEFISEIIDIVSEENNDKTLWEYFLHKVYDKSYIDFKKECTRASESEKPVDFETAINDSISILDGFVPE